MDRSGLEATTNLGGGNEGEWRVVVTASAIFAALSVICAVLSDGFVTFDACTHYLYARFAFSDPVNLVDVWGRPFCTELFALPARLGGRLGVRIVSMLVAIGCGMVAWRIARGQRQRWPVLALLFTLGQPLLFVYSFAEMTELPFALLLVGAFLAFQGRRWFWAALLAGLTPTARPEGFGFVLLGGFALLVYRRWMLLPVLLLPLAAWDIGGWAITARTSPWWRWLIDAWPWSAGSLYGRGNPLTFVAALPLIVSPLVLPATLIGLWRNLVDPWREQSDNGLHLRICRVSTAVIPLGVLIVHSLLRALGKLGSYGEPRYLLIAAPLWGVLSARGWQWAFDRLRWKHPIRWALGALALPILLDAIWPVVPLHLTQDWKTAERFSEWYKSSPRRRDYPNLVASHPGIFYFLNEDPSGRARRGGFTRGVLESPPPGTLLVWDPILSSRNANVNDATTLAAIDRAGWMPEAEVDALLNQSGQARTKLGASDMNISEKHWHVFHSPLKSPKPAAVP